MRNATTLIIIAAILSITAGCATAPHRAALKSGSFLADNEFVVEMEHDTAGNPVDVSVYGPVPQGQSCEQYESMILSGASKHNPPGFRSQGTCLHVRFVGPLGPHGAVVVQPARSKPLSYALIAAGYSKMGAFIGMQPLHVAPDVPKCTTQAHDIIDSNVKDGTIRPDESLLIYCTPIPALPTATTLPNGDSVL